MTTPTPPAHAGDPAPLVENVEADPGRPYKAYAATLGTALGAGVAYWIADAEPFTGKDAGKAFLSALLASGVTGLSTFKVTNPLRRKPPRHARR